MVSTRINELGNEYTKEGFDIILINSHSLINEEKIRLMNYNVYQRNVYGERNDGIAIMIKSNLKHKLDDDFVENFLAVEVETDLGPVIIATCYQPPRRNYLSYPDMLKLANTRKPVYLLGDFNANHQILGYNHCNTRGKIINSLLNNNHFNLLGPNFKTFISTNGSGRPDLVLANRNHIFNTQIEPGFISSSDHLPVFFTVSVHPLQTPAKENYEYNKANWDLYKDHIERNMKEVTNLQGKMLKDIDNELKQWHKEIENAINQSVPKSRNKTLPHYRNTENIRNIKTRYKNLKNLVRVQGWSQEFRIQYNNLRQNIVNELKNQQKWKRRDS